MKVRGESSDNRGRQTMEKRRLSPHTITLPPLKTCTTSTRLDSLQVSIIEDNTTVGVLWEGTVCNDMSQVITKGTVPVWTIAGGVANAGAKRTVVVQAMVLGVAWGMLETVGTLILWTVDVKMPHGVAVKTNSLWSCCHGWAQAGVSRNNSSRIGHSMSLRSDSS